MESEKSSSSTVEHKLHCANASVARASSLNRRMLRGGIWILVWRVVGTVLGLVTNVVLTHILSPALFGGFVIATNVISGCGMVARFGTDRTIIKYSGQAFALGEKFHFCFSCGILQHRNSGIDGPDWPFSAIQLSHK